MKLIAPSLMQLVIGMASVLAVSASWALNLERPGDAYQAMLRVVGDLDGKPVFKDWNVTVFAVQPGSKPLPILRMQGYNAGRLITKPDGSYEWVTREVSYYQDLRTGKIIESWLNPLTQKSVCVVHVANDPVSNKFPALGKESGNPLAAFQRMGDITTLRWDIPLAYPNALQPSDHPEESTGPTYLASEHFVYFANTADLESDNARSTPVHYAWFRTGPWLPWMKMGQTPGYLIYSGHGRKYSSFEELSEPIKTYTLKHHPTFVTAPDSFYQPNETSWTYYAKLKAADKLPRDCR